jgi:chaperonin cofactor prefoldin
MQQRPTRRISVESQQSSAELAGLHMQRGELQSQLEQLQRRRNQLDEQRHVTPNGPARSQLDTRIAELDTRAARLDQQLQGVNDRIVEVMGRVQSGPVIVDIPRPQQITIPPFEGGLFRQRGPDMGQIAGMMAAEAVVFALIGTVLWRLGMSRMRAQFDRMFTQQTSQMNQLQQSVDTIAVEVERISEGQRYVAKQLSEGAPAEASRR